jgi:hypothetical protein
MTCLSPAVPSGDAVRICLGSGDWTGAPLVCTLPDPCIPNPCAAGAYCVGDRVVAETKTFRNDVLKLRGGELSKRSGNEFTDSTRKNIRKASDLTESQIRKLKKG